MTKSEMMAIETSDIAQMKIIASRLIKGDRIDIDLMRTYANCLYSIVDRACEIPPNQPYIDGMPRNLKKPISAQDPVIDGPFFRYSK